MSAAYAEDIELIMNVVTVSIKVPKHFLGKHLLKILNITGASFLLFSIGILIGNFREKGTYKAMIKTSYTYTPSEISNVIILLN